MKKRILVIDDQKIICDLADRWLTSQGYEILRAYDSKTGYQIAEDEIPDLLLIDILLPGISGIDLCHKIRENGSLKHISIILMSAIYKDRGLINQIKNIADDFIEKPFKKEELITKVKKYLSNEVEKANDTFMEAIAESLISKSDKKTEPGQEIKFEYTKKKDEEKREDISQEIDQETPFPETAIEPEELDQEVKLEENKKTDKPSVEINQETPFPEAAIEPEELDQEVKLEEKEEAGEPSKEPDQETPFPEAAIEPEELDQEAKLEEKEEADEPSKEPDQETPFPEAVTESEELNQDIKFEYTDPVSESLVNESSPTPSSTDTDEILSEKENIRINLFPASTDSNDNKKSLSKSTPKKTTHKTDKLIQEELDKLFKIIKDKKK